MEQLQLVQKCSNQAPDWNSWISAHISYFDLIAVVAYKIESWI